MSRTAIITGGGKRVGESITRALLDDGWSIVAHVHHDDDAVPDGAIKTVADLAQPDCAGRIFGAADGLPPVRLLINNAARFAFDGFGCASAEEFDAHMKVNARAPMLLIDELSRTGQDLSVLRKPFERYAASGEINTQVDDPAAVIERVSGEFADGGQDRLDGLTVDCGSWWFNLRPSNTEPLLRLNLEAATRDECDQHVAELLVLITGP